MKKIRIPIFTEEYFINVCLGKQEELIKELIRYGGCSQEYAEEHIKNMRGKAFDAFPEQNPLIVIDYSLPYYIAIATVAHEASHAMDFIKDFLKIEDKSGEFHAHGIAAVMRGIGKIIK